MADMLVSLKAGLGFSQFFFFVKVSVQTMFQLGDAETQNWEDGVLSLSSEGKCGVRNKRQSQDKERWQIMVKPILGSTPGGTAHTVVYMNGA